MFKMKVLFKEKSEREELVDDDVAQEFYRCCILNESLRNRDQYLCKVKQNLLWQALANPSSFLNEE